MFAIQKKIIWRGAGVGCPENFMLFFHRGQCGPGLPLEARGHTCTSSRGCQ